MKKIIWVLFITWAGISYGQEKPEWAVSKIDPALVKNADAVIRSEISRYVIESPRKYIHEVSKTVTIYDEESPESYVIIPYDKYSKAELISATLYDAGGSFLRKVKKSEILDQAADDGNSILNDLRLTGFRSFGGQLPYTIEYKWQIINNETLFYYDWKPGSIERSVEHATFTLDTPEELVVHTKTLNYTFDYKKENKDGRIIQSWTIENFKAITPEQSGPPIHEITPTLLFSPASFQVGEYIGSMSDWKSFGAFMYDLNKGREKVTPEMAALIRLMTSHCSTPQCKIDTLYHWMQQNMRYVSVQLGIGGWQAFDAPYVEKNRYGDCKALSTFMKGMLQEVGIESWQVLIKWDEEESLFLDDFASNDFNHMMLHIPQENMWLECTSNNLPTGYIDRDEEKKKVLLMTPEGGKIATTPSTPVELNQVHSIDSIYLEETILIRGKKKFSGNRQRGIRGMFYDLSLEDRRKYFLEHFPLTMKKLDQFEIKINPSGEESLLSYSGIVNQLGSISGTRYFIPVKVIHPSFQSCGSNTDRTSDFISRENFTETNDIYIALPTGFTIEFLPPESKLNYKGNQYLLTTTSEKGFIHIHHQLIHKAMRLSPDEYKELCTYYQAVAKSNAQTIVLKKERT